MGTVPSPRPFWVFAAAGLLASCCLGIGACGGSFSASDDGGGDGSGGDTSLSTDGPGMPETDGQGLDGSNPGIDARLPDVFDEVPPSCEGGFACVPAQPIGWQMSDGWNIFEVFRGGFPSDGGAPPCDPNFTLYADTNAEFVDAGAHCQCGCDPAADPCPSSPALQHVDMACGDVPCATIPLQSGVCAYLNDTCNGTAAATEVPPPTPAGCTPDASTTVPPPFAATVRACVSQYAQGSSDCQPGTVCQPVPGGAYESKLCIAAPGERTCPGQGYADRRVYYASFTDDRGCGACSCGPPKQQCSASFHLYQFCPNTNDYGGSTSCLAHNPLATFAIVSQSQVSGTVGCDPSSAGPQGGVMLSGALTLCCLP